jgi:hypothetical protein
MKELERKLQITTTTRE